MKKLVFILLFIPLISFGQTKVELDLCLALQTRNFISDSEAKNALKKILSVIDNYNQNFVMIPCSEINNAAAIKYNGVRYILYDKEFMKKISSYTNDWSNLFILAHEVGHHYYDHTQDIANSSFKEKSLETLRDHELEADAFAGSVLYKLGASINQTLEITTIFPDEDDAYSIHPNRSKRSDAINQGYYNNSSIAQNSKPNSFSAEYYYNLGNESILYDENNEMVVLSLPRAISYYSKSIQIDPTHIFSYMQRGSTRSLVGDYIGAIEDLTKTIEFLPNDNTFTDSYSTSSAYAERGNYYYSIKEYSKAMADFQKAIKLEPNNSNAYFLLFVIRASKLKDLNGCLDLQKAIYIQSNNKTPKSIFKNRFYYSLSTILLGKNSGGKYGDVGNCGTRLLSPKWKNEVDNFIKSLENRPPITYTSAFSENKELSNTNNKSTLLSAESLIDSGNQKRQSGDYYGAISDFTKAINIKPNDPTFYLYRASTKNFNISDYQGAVIDYNKAIEVHPRTAENPMILFQRGYAKLKINDFIGAINDNSKAIDIDPKYANAYNNRATAKGFMGDESGACKDFRKAASLGYIYEKEQKLMIESLCN